MGGERGATGQREVLEGPRRPGAARSAGEHSNPPRGRVKFAMLRHADSCCGISTCEGKAMGNGREGEGGKKSLHLTAQFYYKRCDLKLG